MTPKSALADQRKSIAALLEQGRLAECEAAARALLAAHPADASGWNLLGVCLAVAGRFEEALHPLQQTATLDPTDADAHKLVGDVLQRLGRSAEAEHAYARSLELAPDNVEVRLGLGNVLVALGRPAAAEPHFRRAAALAPKNVQAHTNLGVALRDLGRPAEAVESCRRALELKPGAFRAHNNLGNALKDLGRLAEAEQSYRHALEHKPDNANAHRNLGALLGDLRRLGEAEQSCRRALEIEPNAAETWNVLGIVLRRANRPTEAKAAFRRAVELAPERADAHNNLGNLLRELGEQAESEAALRRALEIDPDFHQARSNLIFAAHHRPHTAVESLELARAYGARVSRGLARPGEPARDAASPEPPGPLRVGLVSGDLCEHVVAYFLESVLAQLDPKRIELVAYPTRAIDDERSRKLRARCARWRPLTGLDDDAAARAIREDGVHVLLDLAGHTAHNRLPVFARRPAPVQASWLGYFDTTGLPEIDWVLTDETAVPRGSEGRFSERLWYLPDTRLCFTPPDGAPAVSPLPALTSAPASPSAAGAANAPLTFGCVQELAKVNEGVLDVWARILRRLPNARLRMQSRAFADAALRGAFLERLRARGVPASVVQLHGPVAREAYLAGYSAIDVALDTFPYPGGTTTCEALWMGVPTLTLAGDDMLARQGASLLKAAGLADWVANDEDEYVEKAVALAADATSLAALASLRSTLRARVAASPVFDARRFARNLEAALFGMWSAPPR
jgi:predicted O-linked N-acetylglucosamine transferase (SPINDLY family)